MLPKINRRGFFLALFTALLPKEQLEGWSIDLGRPADRTLDITGMGGEDMLDDLSLTTLGYLRGMPAFYDMDIAPIWSGEVFPTYGSISRNGPVGPHVKQIDDQDSMAELLGRAPKNAGTENCLVAPIIARLDERDRAPRDQKG